MSIGRRAVVAFVFVAVVALVAACSSDKTSTAQPPSSGSAQNLAPATSAAPTTTAPACNRPQAAGLTSQSFDFDGVSRTYQQYVPAAYDGTKPVPVVFNFHGYGSNAMQQIVYGDFRPEADRDDFIIIAPD